MPVGIDLSRQTLANWMLRGADPWLKLIYNRMHELLVKKDVLHADETTLQVLHEAGRSASQTSYMWMYRTGVEGPPMILYDYQTTRASKHPSRFLSGFKGYLHVDGYAGYHGLSHVQLVGCWAHARCKFDESIKALPATNPNASVVHSPRLHKHLKKETLNGVFFHLNYTLQLLQIGLGKNVNF